MPDFLLGEDSDPLTLEDGSLWALEGDSGVTAVATVTLRQNVNPGNYWIGDVPVFTATFVGSAWLIWTLPAVNFGA